MTTSKMVAPILSIVIPTREGLSQQWLAELLKVKGDAEFILVHPPGAAKYPVADVRLQQINSPLRGEIIQRMSGLINAAGTYVLSLNCDEFITPEIVDITVQYFTRFPDSWVLRLCAKGFKYGDSALLERPWEPLPPIDKLKICSKAQGNSNLYSSGEYLLEMPIAPLENSLDIACIFRDRKDHHGSHIENFDKKVWRNDLVQEAIEDLAKLLAVGGPFKYVPFWCLDRLLGLFIQAKFFESGKVIGHWFPQIEQIRMEDNPPQFSQRSYRLYVFAEILLLRRFRQYGYLWNLILVQLRSIPLVMARYVRDRFWQK